MCFPAFAGHYSAPAYSGGNISPAIPPSSPTDYRLNTDGYWGRDIGLGGAVSTTGTITTVFTWIPDYPGEAPPKSVIVTEYCDAGASAMSQPGSVDGNADNGLGSPRDGGKKPITIVSNGQTIVLGGNGGWSSVGSKYSVKEGATITLTCSPSATATGRRSSSAKVLYRATVSPVVIDLIGTIGSQSGQQQILIEQNVMAGLSGGSFENFLWSVSGSTLYAFRYNVSTTGTDESTGGAVPFPTDTWTLRSPFWYWWKGGEGQGNGSGGQEQTVSVSAKVRLPKSDGTYELVSVSAERKVLVFRPSVGIDYIVFGQTGSSSSGVTSNNVSFNPDEVIEGQGLELRGRVGTPTSFRTQQGTGVWAWLQLCKLYRDYDPCSKGTKHSEYVLDSNFPYATFTSPDDPDPVGDPNGAGSTKDKPKPFGFVDTPSQDGLPYSTHITVNDAFKLYVMYTPPYNGVGCTWVPVYLYEWGWNANATKSFFGGRWSPPVPGSVQSTGQSNDPDIPKWSIRHQSGSD